MEGEELLLSHVVLGVSNDGLLGAYGVASGEMWLYDARNGKIECLYVSLEAIPGRPLNYLNAERME